MLVLLGELSRRVTRDASGVVIWSGFTQRPFDVKDIDVDLDEFGFRDDVQVHLASFECDNAVRRDAFARGIAAARAARDSGRHVLLVLLTESGFEADLDSSYPLLTEPSSTGSITTLVVGTQLDTLANRDAPPLASPWTGRIVLDRTRSRRNLYPAIDPELSSSTADATIVGEAHLRAADAVRTLLADYRQQDPGFDGLIEAPANAAAATAHAALRYLAQPFYTTEPFTGVAGQRTSQADLLKGLAAFLPG
jgi:F0F1-type ATP synthase beta subunit